MDEYALLMCCCAMAVTRGRSSAGPTASLLEALAGAGAGGLDRCRMPTLVRHFGGLADGQRAGSAISALREIAIPLATRPVCVDPIAYCRIPPTACACCACNKILGA
jgi:hypothetical protein